MRLPSRKAYFILLQRRLSLSAASGPSSGGGRAVTDFKHAAQCVHGVRKDDESYYDEEVTQASLDTDSEDDRLPPFSENVVATSNDHADKCEAGRQPLRLLITSSLQCPGLAR